MLKTLSLLQGKSVELFLISHNQLLLASPMNRIQMNMALMTSIYAHQLEYLRIIIDDDFVPPPTYPISLTKIGFITLLRT